MWRAASWTIWARRLVKKGSVPTKRVGPPAHKSCEGRIDLAAGAGVKDLDLQPHGAGSRFHVSQRDLVTGTGRIDQHGNTSGSGYQLTQEFQPLCHQLSTEKIDSCQVAAWPGEASDKARPDRVFGDDEDDGDRRGCRLGRKRRSGTSERGDHGDPPTSQFGRQRRQSIGLIFGPAVFNRHVLALDIAGVFETLAKCAQLVRDRSGLKEPDHRHRRLLRPRRARPPRRRAAERR
jgi:hypothetical protein